MNAILRLATELFPDDSGTWSISEMVEVTRQVYNDPNDIKITDGKFYDALGRLTENPDWCSEEVSPVRVYDHNEYSPAVCRRLLRLVIKGRLPKNYRPRANPEQTHSQNPDAQTA